MDPAGGESEATSSIPPRVLFSPRSAAREPVISGGGRDMK